jgi:hypothetical protein
LPTNYKLQDQAFYLPQVLGPVSMYRKGERLSRMLQRHARGPVSLDKLDRCRIVCLAVSVVVAYGEDNGSNPDQRRPVGGGEVDGQRSGEARPDDDESAVQESKAVDVDAKLA